MEDVVPAIQTVKEKMLKELSPQEFQQMLSSWFQDKGIVQDMKSYLKFQMINVLRNTVVGRDIKKSASQTYSLAQQALHLIVAEYLLYHQCHFALSLFSTEVNLSNILPESSLFFGTENMPKESASKFDKENLINILELTGISRESQITVLHRYFDKNEIALLPCLLGLIDKDGNNATNKEECNIDEEYEDEFLRNVCMVLQSSNLPHKTYMQLLNNLKVCYDLKTKSYESQVVQLVNKFKKELNSREQKLYHAQKRRRYLERRLVKLREENMMLRGKLEVLPNKEMCVQNGTVIEKIVTAQCSLCHCSEECTNNKRLCESYKKEIEKLKTINSKQNEEIERLNLNCNELFKELNSCQSKINLVNAKMEAEFVHETQRGYKEGDKDSISLSSDSITEEVLQQARQKLKLLEEESEELDIRFSNFLIK